MPGRAPIDPNRIRKIRGSFSWIEHRFLHDGFLQALSPHELLLYYFLVTVGDRYGVSYYSYEKICQLLEMDVDAYIRARNALVDRHLIAFHQGVFQVLALPERARPVAQSPPHGRQRRRLPPPQDPDFHSFAALIKQLKEAL